MAQACVVLFLEVVEGQVLAKVMGGVKVPSKGGMV